MLHIFNQILLGKYTFMQLTEVSEQKQIYNLVEELISVELTILEHPKGRIVLTGLRDVALYFFPPAIMNAIQECLMDKYNVVQCGIPN